MQNILNEDETYLVGGIVRDILTGREDIKDVDIVTKNPKHIINKFSERIRTCVLLDEKFQVYRLFFKDEKNYYVDITKLQGQDIREDLSRRDFTVNAVAVKNGAFVHIIDPYNGVADIQKKVIKEIDRQNIIDDPLRILRAFRLKATCDFEIEEATLKDISMLAQEIGRVAEERVKSEIFKILNSSRAKDIFSELFKTGVLTTIFPFIKEYEGYFSGKRHSYDLLDHSLKMMEFLEKFYNNNSFPIYITRETVDYETEYEGKVIALLKLAALFHDVGKLFTRRDRDGKITYYEHEKMGAEFIRDFLTNKKYATETVNFIVTLIRFHMYPFYLIQFGAMNANMTPRSYLKLKKAFGERVAVLFNFAVCDSLATSDDDSTKTIIELIKKLYDLYVNYEAKEKKVSFLSGNEIMNLLNIKQGPLVGEILTALKEASLSGAVNSKDDAVMYIKSYYEKSVG